MIDRLLRESDRDLLKTRIKAHSWDMLSVRYIHYTSTIMYSSGTYFELDIDGAAADDIDSL